MNVAGLIASKRDGGSLSREQIEFLIAGYADGSIPDYQMSALAMAILLKGMSSEETVCLTRAMLGSGIVLQWGAENVSDKSGLKLSKVDKHSTGGVGDKISIMLAPLLAACGVAVPMISGRGLGPTGGTLDKLESITSFRTDLSTNEIRNVIDKVGCVITGASAEIAPADKKLYALRDVTATVESIPLITASILSKKLAEGLDALVLDVKFGSGAFMKTYELAHELATSLVNVANQLGTRTTAILTDMNQPLGVMCGNANEILESVEMLQGGGPDDVRELTIVLSAELLVNSGAAPSIEEARTKLVDAINSGAAIEKYNDMIRAQGGDPDRVCELAAAHQVVSSESGFIEAIDTRELGMIIIELGGGRRALGDQIDFSTGLAIRRRIGDEVKTGDVLLDVLAENAPDGQLCKRITSAFRLSQSAVDRPELIRKRITFSQPSPTS